MIYSRIAAKLPNYVPPIARRLRVAPLLQASCRSISSGLNHRRFKSASSVPVEHFLGTWVQEAVQNYPEALDAFGVRHVIKQSLLNNRTLIDYSKEDDHWVLVLGVEGMGTIDEYNFQFGEPFVSNFFDGRPLNSIIHKVNGNLEEKHETIDLPTKILKIIRTIRGGKMLTHYQVGDTYSKMIYRRR